MRYNGVPVIMYHSVMPRQKIWGPLCIPKDLFEAQLSLLHNAGFQTINLHQLHLYMEGKYTIPDKSIVLTFDDGYLDNWIHAYPLLKKYGFTATLFPALDFIAEGECRLRSDKITEKVIDTGYLNWSEIEAMHSSGVFDVQSHTMTHTWLFKSPEIIDFHHPGDEYAWLDWNEDPGSKPEWQPNKHMRIAQFGYPVFEYDRALGSNQFIISDALKETAISFVAKHGNADYFSKSNWRRELKDIANSFSEKGRFETDIEQKKRIDYELVESKKILEDRLNCEIKFLCWPGGASKIVPKKLWKSYGYLAATLPSAQKGNRKNKVGEDPSGIRRISCMSTWNWRGKMRSYHLPIAFRFMLEDYFGNPFAKWFLRVIKASYFIKKQ